MTQDFSIAGIFSQKKRDGTKYDPIGKIAGFGGLVGIVAAVYGLVFSGTDPLFHITGEGPSSAMLLLLLAVGLLLQTLGGKGLRIKLGSAYSYVGLVGALVGIAYYPFLMVSSTWPIAFYDDYVTMSAFLTALFILLWQMYSIVFPDSTNSWIGLLTGLCNGLFFPLYAIGTVYGAGIIMLAFVMLILGQFLAIVYWWSPLDIVREYARSPERAKFSFGLSGLIAFLIGAIAVFANVQATPEGVLWYPFSNSFDWNYPLVLAFICALLYWVLQGPRLGKKELKAAHISEDLLQGGKKYFPAFLLAVGIIGVIQAATGLEGAAETWALLIVWSISGTMFMVGASYLSRADVVTGLPLVLSSVMLSIHPAAIAEFVIIPFLGVIITQALLTVETKIRGFTYYSQPFLTVIVTIAFSLIYLGFILGFFGSGPAALWPTNRWFNVALFPAYDMATQAATVFVLPITALIIRNVSVGGYGHMTGQTNDIISGITMLFAFVIPAIEAAFKGVTHQALTAAAIMLGLYIITFVLILSQNLTLAGAIEDKGAAQSGNLLRVTVIVSLVLGVLISLFVMVSFSSVNITALEISAAITALVILIAGLEILLSIGWVIAGARLGMFTSGFRFTRPETA